jgi:hypothetical protein
MNHYKLYPATITETIDWNPKDISERKAAIIQNYLRGTESYLAVGCLLWQAKKAGDWRNDGSEAKNWWQWVQFELKIRRSNAHRMMYVWEKIQSLLPKHKELVLGINFSNLVSIAPILEKLKTEDLKIEWLHKAETNSVRDLDNNIREASGGLSTDLCDHDGEREPYFKCVRCNKFLKG